MRRKKGKKKRLLRVIQRVNLANLLIKRELSTVRGGDVIYPLLP